MTLRISALAVTCAVDGSALQTLMCLHAYTPPRDLVKIQVLSRQGSDGALAPVLLAVLLSQIPALGSTMSGLGAVGRSPALEQPPEQRRMVRARRDNVPEGLCKLRGTGKMLVLMITLQHVNYMLTLESRRAGFIPLTPS